jgi:hypothetical protein
LDGIFEAEQRGKKENRLHRRNKGLGKPRYRLFPRRQYMRKPIILNDCIF